MSIIDAPTKRERDAIEKRLTSDPNITRHFEEYKESFEEQKRIDDQLYFFQKVQIEGDFDW